MIPKIDIISGFLGAGKTTLINKILKDIIPLEKIALIENEFGEIGVDGQLFQKHGVEIKEISSGCICCTLYGDFVSALKKLISQIYPQRIIIEPTGVGKLSDVLKAVEAVGKIEKIKINMLIAVVDPLKYEMYSQMFGEFFQDQIQTARTVMLSRTQLAEKEAVKKAVNEIMQQNHHAKIIAAPWDQLTGAEIIKIGEQYEDTENNHKEHFEIDHHHHENEDFQVWSQKTVTKYSKEQFQAKLNKLQDKNTYGTVLRGKGFFQTTEGDWLQYDYVSGEINFNKIDGLDMGKIVIIGKDIKKFALEKLFMAT